jgi:hydrogenase maturation protease
LNIAILGIGNVLLMDEGVGVHIINKLREEYKFPKYVKLIDGGTMGLDLLPFFEGNDKVLIIDAVDFKKDPGTIDSLTGDEIPRFLSSKLSVHQIGLPDMLFAAKLMGITPSEMCLIGIQPKSMEFGTELSEEVRAQMGALLERVFQKLKEWGVGAVPKPTSPITNHL